MKCPMMYLMNIFLMKKAIHSALRARRKRARAGSVGFEPATSGDISRLFPLFHYLIRNQLKGVS